MTVSLDAYDWIVVNSSAGKDSQAMLDYVVTRCRRAGVPTGRVVVAHADLGRMEWEGTKELARRQAAYYGVRFEAVRRRGTDLLARVLERGKWPDAARRWCTSDFKRSPVTTLHTRLAAETRQAKGKGHRVTILNCLGMRSQESANRAKLPVFEHGDCGRNGKPTKGSNGVKRVDTWHPIHSWTVDEVWAGIRASGAPYHPAYDLGMPRLSCVFCIFAPRNALMLAGSHNRGLLREYAEAERTIGHTFRHNFRIADVERDLEADVVAGPIQDWTM